MTLQISSDQMAIYKHAARARQARDEQEMLARRGAAWQVARNAARLLQTKFGATRVIAFGSLARGGWFHAQSDIDLAVEGILPDKFFRAWAALDYLDSPFEIDLIALERAPARWRHAIDLGVDL